MIDMKALRKQRGYTQKDMGKKLGISQQGYSAYENGKTSPDPEMLYKIASLYGCSMEYLVKGWQAAQSKTRKIAVYTGLSNTDSLKTAPILDEMEVDRNLYGSDQEYFALIVADDAMYPHYLIGDIVLIKKQTSCVTGNDIVVSLEGKSAVIRRYENYGMGLVLRALNTPKWKSEILCHNQMESLPITILGVIVELRRRINL